MSNDPEQRTGGLGGTVRLIPVFAILALALLAALVVLDVIPREQLAEWGTKIGLLAAIAVAAVVGIAAMMGGRR